MAFGGSMALADFQVHCSPSVVAASVAASALPLRPKRPPVLLLFAVASSATVSRAVVREASSTEETSPLSRPVVSSAAAPPPLSLTPGSLVRGSIPYGIPRRLVRRGADPHSLLIASSVPAATPSLPVFRLW